jgi:hypothetical protein
MSRFQIRRRHLLDTLHGVAYRRRLAQGWRLLSQWAAAKVESIAAPPQNSGAAESLLCAFLQDFYERCPERLLDARHAVLAYQHRHPSVPGGLRRAWDRLRSWALERPVQNRRPLLVALLRVLYVTSLMCAFQNSADMARWVRFAVCLRLGFHCLLRP